MAIGCIHSEWMFWLKRQGMFRPGSSLIDLGPQDIQVPLDYLKSLADREGDRDAAALVGAIYRDGAPRRDAQAAYYKLFGFDRYESADLEDDRATYKLDLNHAAAGLPKYDVVTDFGTMEHVYDIARVFETMHGLLHPGGLALHVVPAFAFPNHGFYTPNPNLFVEFARANGYRVVDFSYVDNMFVREKLAPERAGRPTDFAVLPIQRADMQDTQIFMTKVVRQFHRNILADDTRRALEMLTPGGGPYPADRHHLCFVFDLLFVALAKPMDERPIVAPIQRMEGVAPLAGEKLPPASMGPGAPSNGSRPLWRRLLGR